MAGGVFSENWHRVAGLRPRLRAHARIHRQRFRGADWFVAQDDQTGRFHRLAPAAHHMVSLMNGRRSMAEIWTLTLAWMGPEAEPPTQDDVIRLLAQLHAADLLAGDAPPDLEELARRAGDRARATLMSRVRNPLALRLPLVDPDRFLDATAPLARLLFSPVGLIVWLVVVASGTAIAAMRWDALSTAFAEQALLAENLVLAAAIYPAIKALHELGHGWAVKRWGGEVREMGLMLLVLIPVPYVDASAASGFPSKWQRAVVGGAGILVELFIAGLAMIVWATAEPGFVRAAAFNAAIIGGVSTLLFNGNPLLRFDGYFVLCDLVEIPNLGARANRHIAYLVKRHAFGLPTANPAVTARGEAAWFLLYGVAAWIYRLAIMLGIALFVAGQLFFVGVLLAVWAVWSALLWPAAKGLWWLLTAPDLRRRRRRALLATGALAGTVVALLFATPAPYATTAEGVTRLPEDAAARTGEAGFVAEVLARPGETVAAGQPLLRLEAQDLAHQRAEVAARHRALTAALGRALVVDLVDVRILREQLESAAAMLARLDDRIAALVVRAPAAGLFITQTPDDMPGAFLPRGAQIGWVAGDRAMMVRVVVPEETADLVRRRLDSVAVAFVDAPHAPRAARIAAETPKATRALPSPALAVQGGGAIAVDPTAAPDAPTALAPFFEFDLALTEDPGPARIGVRAHVRFDHGREAVAWRLVRAIRQVFLRQFDV